MKIKVKQSDYDTVMALPRPEHKNPCRPNPALRALVRLVSASELKAVRFSYNDNVPEEYHHTPCLILMNHSCFTDLGIAARILKDHPYNIICTSDGFVGKEGLMRAIGCVPTQKFVSDFSLIKDMEYCLKELKTGVLMYPEASYSFDGCATPLPRRLGILLKKLGVPVLGIKTYGAFHRDPLYNCLQKRDVTVTADFVCLLTPEEIASAKTDDLDRVLDDFFTFDSFAWQKENGVTVSEPFRADGLNRILFRCPSCQTEGKMEGKGTRLTCHACEKEWKLTPLGEMQAVSGETEFSHIPDWYRWEREEVRKELAEGTYRLEIDVDIAMMVDFNAIYQVGSGHLSHTNDGFVLTDDSGRELYSQKPNACYSLYSDYFWYELGDIICIGSKDALFYCFPKGGDVAARTRIAAEELFKMNDRHALRRKAKQAEGANTNGQ